MASVLSLLYRAECSALDVVRTFQMLDRRSLANPSPQDVVDLWKSLIENKIDDPSVIGPILEGQDAERPPKMCKKCFTVYRTCARQHVALDTNLRKAADNLGLVCRSSEASESPPAPRGPDSACQ